SPSAGSDVPGLPARATQSRRPRRVRCPRPELAPRQEPRPTGGAGTRDRAPRGRRSATLLHNAGRFRMPPWFTSPPAPAVHIGYYSTHVALPAGLILLTQMLIKVTGRPVIFCHGRRRTGRAARPRLHRARPPSARPRRGAVPGNVASAGVRPS